MRMWPLWGTSMGCPSAQMVPEVGRSSPAIKLSTVDLPHPDGPTMQRNSPSFTARLMFSKATRVPPGDGKERETFSKMSLLSRSQGVSDTLDMIGASDLFSFFPPPIIAGSAIVAHVLSRCH